jgi:hypothetical protein
MMLKFHDLSRWKYVGTVDYGCEGRKKEMASVN